MSRSKVIFLIIALLFLIGIGVASYDIASQTTAPWEKSHMKNSLNEIADE